MAWFISRRGIYLAMLFALLSFCGGILFRPVAAELKNRLRDSVAPSMEPRHMDHWRQRLTEFEGLGTARRIVFLGDSRIESGEWSELLGRDDISNRGIDWDTTVGVLRRLPGTLPDNVEICVLQIGINDILQGAAPGEVAERYREILRHIQSQTKARAVVTSIIPLGAGRPVENAKVAECNESLARICAECGATFLDLNPVLASGGILEKRFTHDGVHLSWQGYARLRDILRAALH